MDELAGKRVTVAGLGRFGGGIAVTKWLVAQGARVLVTDRAKPEVLADAIEQLRGLPVEYHLGGHREEDFTSPELVVASPAIPPGSPYLVAARTAGVPVTTEIRLFIERCPAPIFGVTGTKGKSTTTAMLGRILARKFITHVGGNIGGSLLGDLPLIRPEHLVVLELSSFMLEYLGEDRWSPHVAVVTMLADDHLDRHGTSQAYIDAKKNIVRFQRPGDYAVLGEACPHRTEFTEATAGKVILYSPTASRPFTLALSGAHNQINAQAAFAAGSVMDIDWQDAQEALADFKGLPHRLELVHEAGGVRWYNDSIATIPQAAVAAMDSFPAKRVIQIVGGHDKKLPFGPLVSALVDRAKAALCIGETGPEIARMMGEAARVGSTPTYLCGDLTTAMKMARSIARPGDVVLLSPGCASYGEFRNFEERGEIFARLAREEAPQRPEEPSPPC